MKRYLFIFVIVYSSLFAKDNYLLSFQNNKTIHFEDIQKDYNETQTYYEDIFKKYKQSIEKNFQEIRLSKGYKYVVYDKTFTQRITIDFRNGYIYIDIIALEEKVAAQKTLEAFNTLMEYDLNKIIKNNYMEQKLAHKKQRAIETIDNNLLFVGMLYSKKETIELYKFFIEKTYDIKKLKDKNLFSTRLTLPKYFDKEYNRYYKKYIDEYAQKYKLEPFYLWALVENESGFNPYLDVNQKYGLVQLSSLDASKAYYRLTGIYKSFYVENLFDVKTNLDLGTNYLSFLYYKEFHEITDTINKIYTTLLVYHFGLEHLLSALRVETKMELIALANFSTSDQFYKYLMKKLPRDEKIYFFRLTQDIKKYKQNQ